MWTVPLLCLTFKSRAPPSSSYINFWRKALSPYLFLDTFTPMDSRKPEEIALEFLPFLRVYKDGHVERLYGSEIVPPSLHDPQTGVSSKDVTISSNISARLHHPDLNNHQKLPLLVYFHGGGFCLESAFSFLDHRYLNKLASQAKLIAVSVEYRLAPEHLPAAYDDCWEALQWAISQAKGENTTDGEEWLKYADVDHLFLGGDSAGGNIVHNIAMRAGVEGLKHNVKIKGAFLGYPYFWGSKPIGSEPNMDPGKKEVVERMWALVSPAGLDDPLFNPTAPGAPSLAGLGCERVLVCVAEKDVLVERGRVYCDALKKSGWGGEVELYEVDGEDHAFHIFSPESEKAKLLFERLASFFSKD